MDDMNNRIDALAEHLGIDAEMISLDPNVSNCFFVDLGKGCSYLVLSDAEARKRVAKAIEERIQSVIDNLPEEAVGSFDKAKYQSRLYNTAPGKLLAIDHAERTVSLSGEDYFIYRIAVSR